jgi:hypothetical protein
LEKEPDRRYQYASEVGADVETICADEQAKARFSPGRKASNDVKSIRNRVWIPAVVLLVVGVIHFMGLIGVLWSAFVPGDKGLVLAIFMAAQSLAIVIGAWNLMQLRSYRWAVAGSILGIFTPYFPFNLIAGIWGLVLLTKKEVKAAFGQEDTEVVLPPKIRAFTVSTVKEARMAYGRGKAEVQKIIRETRPEPQKLKESDSSEPGKSWVKRIASFFYGFVSRLILSLKRKLKKRSEKLKPKQ